MLGTFMMGSKDNEKGHYSWEDYHKVTLEQGFWLSDTPITQAFWKAVTGNNLSEFKGDNLLVASFALGGVSDKAIKTEQSVTEAVKVLKRCVLRGGSWDTYGRLCRSARRSSGIPDFRSHNVGFRIALGH